MNFARILVSVNSSESTIERVPLTRPIFPFNSASLLNADANILTKFMKENF